VYNSPSRNIFCGMMSHINVSVARSDLPCPLSFNMSFLSRVITFLLIALVVVHDVSGVHTGDSTFSDRSHTPLMEFTSATRFSLVFYFTPGLGACGFRNTGSQHVVSVSTEFFHSFPCVRLFRYFHIFVCLYECLAVELLPMTTSINHSQQYS
jgi:hypothetical protein